MWNWLKNILGVLVSIALILVNIHLVSVLTARAESAGGAANSQGLLEKVVLKIADWGADGIINVALAVCVGILGAWAFLYGVQLGFIGRDGREKTLRYLGGSLWQRFLGFGIFCLLGGVVAGVFQAAQHETFAPIQAFVLGATWPSVVTRVMSGDGSAVTSAGGLTNAPPDAIPDPKAGKKLTDAEVIIN